MDQASYFRELADNYEPPTMTFNKLCHEVSKKIERCARIGLTEIKIGSWSRGELEHKSGTANITILPYIDEYQEKLIPYLRDRDFEVNVYYEEYEKHCYVIKW